jgi:large subunit ribosomal protein L31
LLLISWHNFAFVAPFTAFNLGKYLGSFNLNGYPLIGLKMKPGIHPEYREIVFVDVSNNFSFKTRSTMSTKETIKWEDGKEYPLSKIETSSESHPFYTGTQKIMDTAGRVEKFRQKFGTKAVAKSTGDGAAKTAEKKAAAAEAKAAAKPAAKKKA